MTSGGEDRVKKLRWLCRRGMKELDVLLEAFISNNYDQLEQGGYPQLEALLNEQDDEIWSWIQCLTRPDSPAYQKLIETIKHGA